MGIQINRNFDAIALNISQPHDLSKFQPDLRDTFQISSRSSEIPNPGASQSRQD